MNTSDEKKTVNAARTRVYVGGRFIINDDKSKTISLMLTESNINKSSQNNNDSERGHRGEETVSIISTRMHVQVQTSSWMSEKKNANSPANQTHWCAKWGVLMEHNPQVASPPLRLQRALTRRMKVSKTSLIHRIQEQVKRQKLRVRLIFLPFSLFPSQASQRELASQPNVFIIQMATLSVAATGPCIIQHDAFLLQTDKQSAIMVALRQKAHNQNGRH